MTYDFDTLPNRREYYSNKWNTPNVDEIPLWVADMDFKSPPEVTEALRALIDHGVYGYPIYDDDSVRQTVVDWLEKRHGWQVSVEDIHFVAGVVNGFNQVAHAVAQPGQGVLIQTPAYHHFFEVAENAGLVHEETHMYPDETGEFQFDIQAFEDAITPQTRVFMLCNPHNPTGKIFSKDELTQMAEVCLKHDIIICADEIHSDLVYAGERHVPMASLGEDIAQHTITLVAPSKTFNIAGLKAGVAVIQNPELREKFLASRKGLAAHFINLMGITALKAAYQHGEPWLDALLPYLQANRELFCEAVNARLPGIKVYKPAGTYLAWLDCREANLPLPPAEFFKTAANVSFVEGREFGEKWSGFARANLGTCRFVLEDALDRMETALLNRG